MFFSLFCSHRKYLTSLTCRLFYLLRRFAIIRPQAHTKFIHNKGIKMTWRIQTVIKTKFKKKITKQEQSKQNQRRDQLPCICKYPLVTGHDHTHRVFFVVIGKLKENLHNQMINYGLTISKKKKSRSAFDPVEDCICGQVHSIDHKSFMNFCVFNLPRLKIVYT